MPAPNEPPRSPQYPRGNGPAPARPGTQQPPANTQSIPIRRPGAPDPDRWERDRAAARQLGRTIRHTNNGAGPVHVTLPPEPPRGEDLGVSSVTAEFSAAMVRRGAEERALAQARGTAAPAEADDATMSTLMLDQDQLRQAMEASGAAAAGTARPRWGRGAAQQRRPAVRPAPRRQAPAENAAPAAQAVPAARARSEAEAELYQSVHDDHLFLNNPILVRGLGLAPAVVAAVSGRTALLLALAAALLLTAARVLAVALCHLFGRRQRPLLYIVAAAIAYVPVYCLLYSIFGGELAVLGIYLPLLVADPLVIKRMEAPGLESVDEAWWRGLNNAGGQALALLLIGILRELLASGTVFGITVLANAPLPLAGQPAGGFLLLGLLAAVWTAVGGAYVHYKREEVRYLYADRKH